MERPDTGDNGLDDRAGCELLSRIAGRDERALRELYDRFARPMFGIILHVLRDRSESEDVLQEVFVQIWGKAGTYERRLGTPAAWLVHVARNKAIDRARSRRNRNRADERPFDDDKNSGRTTHFDSPDAVFAMKETTAIVRRAIETLPERQRVLIELAYFEGYSQSELADRLALPLGTVKNRMRSGMMALHQYFSKYPQLTDVHQ